MKNVKLDKILEQQKDVFEIQDYEEYKQVTVSNTGRIKLRTIKKGVQIGTKKQYRIKEGYFIYSRLGIHHGAFGIVPEELDNAIVTGDMPVFKINEKEILPEILIFLLGQKRVKDIFEDLTRGLAQSRIREKYLLDIKIPLPSLLEQKQILKKIQSMENEIKQLETNFQEDKILLTKLKQAILSEAVQGKFVSQDPEDEPASELLKKIKKEKEKLIKERKIKKGKELPKIEEDEIPYELPKSWELCRLNELVSLLGDGLHGTPNYSKEGEYFFINGNNLNNGEIIIKDNTKQLSSKEYDKYKKILNERTIFVSINGTLGNVAFYNNEKIVLGKSACYFNLFEKVNKNYIKLLIETKYFLDYCLKNATGTTIKNVSLNSMRLLPIPLPPLAEQHRIVAKVDELMKSCGELELSIKENKKSSELLMGAVLREAFEN